jgi:Xaa-Pro aminopeptidase
MVRRPSSTTGADFYESSRSATHRHSYDRPETFADFRGARNEGNPLVTADGYRILGKPRPRTIGEVEAIRQG